ncbi:glutathione S-transferase family protein [Sphingobium estronivorans]|uniref:glutathione S-transferase family protein n=1 Tax=Sphingobium estronivorans TaxID=1577690 RepID=UPI00123AB9C0|nr:glutathione S-transferase family protein [Sphingobium estronivorans]
MILYYHPLSSYCWKVLIALYENATPFEGRILEDPAVAEAWLKLWPIGKFPVLRDEVRDRTVAEASIIVEYLGQQGGGSFRPIPQDADAALEVRLMDRLFDNYVMTPVQTCVGDRIRPEGVARDSFGVAQARASLGKAYALLEARMAGRRWAAGAEFTLADCAAAPALFYADRIVPMRGDFPGLAAYLDRLEARESFARVLREKEPWWHLFPFADG